MPHSFFVSLLNFAQTDRSSHQQFWTSVRNHSLELRERDGDELELECHSHSLELRELEHCNRKMERCDILVLVELEPIEDVLRSCKLEPKISLGNRKRQQCKLVRIE